jgi:sortase A
VTAATLEVPALARPASRRARLLTASTTVTPASVPLLVLAVVAVWMVAFALVLTPLQEHRDQQRLYAGFRQQLAEATAPVGGAVGLGAPVALVRVPALGLDAVVVEGTAAPQLTLGPGHEGGTPLPGQPGTAVVFGRALTHGSPFKGLGSLRVGETARFITAQGAFAYVVTGIRRPGDRLPAAHPAGTSYVVLVSAEGPGTWGALAPTRPVYVDLALNGKPAPAAPLTPRVIASGVLATDVSALVPLVLWLQALLLAALCAVWATSRWGGAATWLVAAPVLLAAAWGASGAATQLLPNLV